MLKREYLFNITILNLLFPLQDASITDVEMVTVRVSDILYYWSQHKNLEILKEMDKPYQDTNILGN